MSIFNLLAQPTRDQVLAFAGVFQSAKLVHQLATRDQYDEDALRQSATSVIRLDAESVSEIFAGADGLRLGREVINQVFSGHSKSSSKDMFQYAVGMHQLAIKLHYSTHISSIIRDRLKELSIEHLSTIQETDSDDEMATIYEELAVLYAKTLSTMQPRIMVQGSQGRLSNPIVVNKVRSALFAGIRAAFMWHQLGGRRWQLLIYRRTYQKIARFG